jgi:hypothetical protein
MLKVLIFVPCQNVIVGQDNNSSIISVIESLNINVATDFPEDAALPISWKILTLWHRYENAPEEVIYQQRIEGVAANGKTIIEGEQDFTVSNSHVNIRNILEIEGFPIGISGQLNCRLLLRRKGDESWQLASEFPIGIIHIPKNVNEPDKMTSV